MTLDDLDTLLRAWGNVYGERSGAHLGELPESARAPAVHPIAVAMEFASRSDAGILHQRRGGLDRRRMMGAAAGLAHDRPVPAWACVPSRGASTRSGRSESRDWPVPPELQRVQRAALDLHRIDTLRGLVLRVNYCTRGAQADKALDVTARLGSPVGLKRYRDELAHARTWMHGRLAE